MKDSIRKIPIFILILSSLYFWTDLAFGGKEISLREWTELLNEESKASTIEKVETRTGIRSIFGGTILFIKCRGDIGTKFIRVPQESVDDQFKALRAQRIPVSAVNDALFVFAVLAFVSSACISIIQWAVRQWTKS